MSREILIKKTGMHPFVFQKSSPQAKNFSFQKLKEIYRLIFEADLAIKTGAMEDALALDLLITKICKALEKLFPENKVSIVDRDKGCVDISIYSNHFEKLLGWKAKNGSKFVQKVNVPNWIKENNNYKINCLRGLIETDGSIYNDRGYTMMIFTSVIPALAKDFYDMILSLEFNPHLYLIKRGKTAEYKYSQQDVYHIRLSKNVSKFLELVKPEKI